MRTLEEFNGKFKDKICFIVGSGTSLAEANLEPIKSHLSIAVNSGIIAAPWADFFISDDHAVANWSYFWDLRLGSTTVLLYETKLGHHARWFGSRGVIFRHCKGINVPNRYIHDDKKYHIGETRTSVGSAIMVARTLGCSEIVLLGIDCCRQLGLRYFWQMPSFKGKLPYRTDGVPVDRYKKCKVNGEVTDYDLLDISRTWDNLGEALNKKCKIYNASKISKMTIFPKIDLEKFYEQIHSDNPS